MIMQEIANLTTKQLEQLLAERKAKEQAEIQERRKAYESIKSGFINDMESRARNVVDRVKAFHEQVVKETRAFYELMKEYGELRSEGQRSYTVQAETFRIEVKSCKVKCFDERADIAASRLIDFLKEWIEGRERGADDPMYQLAMMLIERNRNGDLDYKSISKLYDLEIKFNSPEYSSIMQLFKESNIVEGTATNFYFYEKTELGVWRKLEPSFNRMLSSNS